MHIHNVYFWLKSELEESDVQAFEAGLGALIADNNVNSGHFGKPATTEVRDVVDNSYDYGLVLSFEDGGAHDRYQAGDAHLTFVDTHAPKFDRVKVYDIQT